MPALYVAGPTVPDESAPWLKEPGPASKSRARARVEFGRVYEQLLAYFEKLQIDVSLPVADPKIDGLPPAEFLDAITERIGATDALLAFVRPGDPSPYGEALIGGLTGKRVWILAPDPEAVPRLYRGLKGARVLPLAALQQAVGEIAQWLRSSGSVPVPI